MPTFGIGDSLEVSISGVHGVSYLKNEEKKYSFAGPIVQGKLLMFEPGKDGVPGVSFAGGTVSSGGKGFFASPRWEYYFYLAGTSNLTHNRSVLLHVNLGRQTSKQNPSRPEVLLWGIALEARVSRKFHLFSELANGDITAFIPGTASQLGFRYDIAPNIQFDGTVGTGISGNPSLPFWTTWGIKIVKDIL